MPAPQILPTGLTVAANIGSLRRQRGLALSALSQRLAEITDDRRYPTSTLSEIEHGRRRVDVDDLVAIAAVLGVAPSGLLMPQVDADEQLIQTSAERGPIPAEWFRSWLLAKRSLNPNLGAADPFMQFSTDSKKVTPWSPEANQALKALLEAANTLNHEMQLDRQSREGIQNGDN